MTKTVHLTEKNILQIEPPVCGKVELSVAGAPGLKLIVAANGSLRWLYRYRWHTRKRAKNLGVHPGMSVQEAKKEGTRLKSLINQGTNPEAEKDAGRPNPTVAEFVQEHYLHHIQQVQKRPADTIEKLNLRVLPYLGNIPIRAFTRADFEHFRAKAFEGVKRSTINRYHAVVLRVLNYALELGIIDLNPLSGVKKHKESPAQEVFLTEDGAQKLIAELDKARNRAAAGALKLLLLSGMRKGEVLGMTWDCVDLEGGIVYLPDPKSGTPQRVILGDDAGQVLRGMKAHRARKNAYVFPSGRVPGSPVTELRKCFEAALKRAKLPRMRIHDLRHTYASHVIQRGHSLYAAQHLLRHSSPMMTQRYAHFDSETLRRAANDVGQSMSAKRD